MIKSRSMLNSITATNQEYFLKKSARFDNQSHDLKNFYHPVTGGYKQFNN